jgi:2-dehydropantoate 2-reductase
MKIVVFGAGAVGAFFGGLLARAGQDVTFIARGAQFDALSTHGIRIRSLLLGDIAIPQVQVRRHASDVGASDVVLVCVKTNQTGAILDDLELLVGADTTIVTLQNGVDSDEEIAARLGRTRVIPGVVYVGATVETPGVISHVAAGTIVIGPRSPDQSARVAAVREALAATGQPVRVSEDIQSERWRKLVWNAAFNTVSAITGRTPLELVGQEDARALVAGVMREVIAVAGAAGARVQDEEVETQLAWTERTNAIRTSMMVDRERHRAMETEALIGVIVRGGRAHGIATPRSETLYALLKSIETAPMEVRPPEWVPPPL